MVDDIFRRVKNAILGSDNVDDRDERPLPASEDPYGDPADEYIASEDSNVRPASEDPYGDPADGYMANEDSTVRPASEDPYGDPADDEQNWR
jgi:hypothetical protein